MDGCKIRIVSRASNLALAQVREIMDCFPGLDHSVISCPAYGDRHKKISLLSSIPDDFFTRELDQMILSGRVDIAVHSAKDLPHTPRAGLEVVALTKAADRSDALVSSHHTVMRKLPAGVRIGTSSVSRKEQLLRIRPDLTIVSIRGTIEERLALLDQGKIDALVVASCALQRLGLDSRITEILPLSTHPLQGMLAVTAKASRADLKVLFSRIDIRQKYGKVYLIGAGCGNREYLTRQADAALRQAEVIFYDDLIDHELLTDYSAEKHYIGKRKGKHHCSQQEINELLFQAAQSRRRLARLKAGDPFIFGRGGEELSYLQERYVDVEIIPGITAAQGAAAAIGIPLTMRGLSSRFSLLSGQPAPNSKKSDGETLVYYMGSSQLPEIRRQLLKKGVAKNIPVALVHKAGFIDEKVKISTVEKMGREKQRSPLLIIIGRTAALYQKRAHLLFTGLDPYSCMLPGKIIHYPLIEIKPLPYTLKIDLYEGIVFTSKQAVRAICNKYRLLAKHKLISIGQGTTGELEKYGYQANITAAVPDSDEVAAVLQKMKLNKILYPCSNLSKNALQQLTGVEKKVVYQTLYRKQLRLDLRNFSGVVFSSPSTVNSFLSIYKKIPKYLVLYVYGKHTAEKLNEKGYNKNVQTVSLLKQGLS
ncbi:MAG: uroporphyrinogen-III C-methyltransferase [Elusimicrobia bacterium]|nr:uroporphyrinogen-III C-methyltransferase [Elusimicrobiota bacterium]